jgi:hypothetical protein
MIIYYSEYSPGGVAMISNREVFILALIAVFLVIDVVLASEVQTRIKEPAQELREHMTTEFWKGSAVDESGDKLPVLMNAPAEISDAIRNPRNADEEWIKSEHFIAEDGNIEVSPPREDVEQIDTGGGRAALKPATEAERRRRRQVQVGEPSAQYYCPPPKDETVYCINTAEGIAMAIESVIETSPAEAVEME